MSKTKTKDSEVELMEDIAMQIGRLSTWIKTKAELL